MTTTKTLMLHPLQDNFWCWIWMCLGLGLAFTQLRLNKKVSANQISAEQKIWVSKQRIWWMQQTSLLHNFTKAENMGIITKNVVDLIWLGHRWMALLCTETVSSQHEKKLKYSYKSKGKLIIVRPLPWNSIKFYHHVSPEMTPKWYFLWEPLTSTCKTLVLFWHPLKKRGIFAV